MRRWLAIPLALLFTLPLLPSVERSAWANQELHPGARLFYPLWDVSTPNRLTFIVVTRENRRDDSSIATVPKGTLIGGVPTITNAFKVRGTPGNCVPRGAGGSSNNINRTDLGGTSANPVFVDDLHFEFYGKSCAASDETIHMSCADIDLFLLASNDNAQGNAPRQAFSAVAGEGRGALDVHLVTNGTIDPVNRKSAVIAHVTPGTGTSTKTHYRHKQNGADNSLMGHAIISDLAEGWAATYPAAAAKTTSCGLCARIDGGTKVGYENYPREVFLPFALADPFPAGGQSAAPLRNVISLWGPGLLAGANLVNTSINISFTWWDGRERPFTGSVTKHSIIRPLGGNAIAGLDPPIDGSRFNTANFTCGLATSAGKAENDGFPRNGTSSTACGTPLATGDLDHPSDNFEATGDFGDFGHTTQTSTPIGWWRFTLRSDSLPPSPLIGFLGSRVEHSGRGLVGVVLSSTVGNTAGTGIGDATRLWHKSPCEVSSSGTVLGPLHASNLSVNVGDDDDIDVTALWNVFTLSYQKSHCLPFEK